MVVRAPEGVQVKIEVTPVLRGSVFELVIMPVCEQVEDLFGFAEIQVLSFADLYAGKIIAALDRQHPRDLFDVHQLLENEGITDELRTAIIIYLISHDHSPHSLLDPVRCDISRGFEQSFSGMVSGEIALEKLVTAREKLIKDVVGNMPEDHKHFLRSFYSRSPEWKLLELDGVQDLPAVKWRELNLDRSGEGTCDALLRKLITVIG
ncbi:nucleotidyl transferase AbiEii/AbiGii toxin family protein [Microbulbifer sp.]|uniref:nucleotidyl transferase AbiEii/AbiGii toxin family protein n=1 Tax=Microbulbifer sp. TaxID=1908541 RepID=UPI003F30ACB6